MGKKKEVIIDIDSNFLNQNWLHWARLRKGKEGRMPERKERRNREFYRDWKEKGLTVRGLSGRYKLSLEGVKQLKKVLRVRYAKEM